MFGRRKKQIVKNQAIITANQREIIREIEEIFNKIPSLRRLEEMNARSLSMLHGISGDISAKNDKRDQEECSHDWGYGMDGFKRVCSKCNLTEDLEEQEYYRLLGAKCMKKIKELG